MFLTSSILIVDEIIGVVGDRTPALELGSLFAGSLGLSGTFQFSSGYMVNAVVLGCAACGVVLLFINVLGLAISLRASDVDSYADFARETTLPFKEATKQLGWLRGANLQIKEFAAEATRIFFYGMTLIDREDIREKGLGYYRMRIPIWENYILFALAYIKPDTYRDYEFCDYRRALKRGTGRCGQQSLALIGFLAENGVQTGFVAVRCPTAGHVLVRAKVGNDEWYLLDPLFGGVLPYDIDQAADEAQREPAKLAQHFWSEAAATRELDELFAAGGASVTNGGPEARWGRVCQIEKMSYLLKWLLPVLLLLPVLVGVSKAIL